MATWNSLGFSTAIYLEYGWKYIGQNQFWKVFCNFDICICNATLDYFKERKRHNRHFQCLNLRYRLCNLIPLSPGTFEFLFHPSANPVAVVADVVAAPFIKHRTGNWFHCRLDEATTQGLIVQGNGQHVCTNGLHSSLVFVAAEDRLDNVRAAEELMAVGVAISVIGEVDFHSVDKLTSLLSQQGLGEFPGIYFLTKFIITWLQSLTTGRASCRRAASRLLPWSQTM